MAELMTIDALASFLALTFLEIVLGVDNILFVAIAAARLKPELQNRGRQVGLWLALILRVAMLVGLVWITRLEATLFSVMGEPVTIKDLVLIGGGLFLIYKGATEIHDALGEREGGLEAGEAGRAPSSFWSVVFQIGLINVVFSLDSVITAVGMANQLAVMVGAVMVATFLMMVAAKPLGEFIERRPTAKMLGLAFILLVGVALIADGTGFHMPRGYLYFAIGFSLFVEALNMTRQRRRKLASAVEAH